MLIDKPNITSFRIERFLIMNSVSANHNYWNKSVWTCFCVHQKLDVLGSSRKGSSSMFLNVSFHLYCQMYTLLFGKQFAQSHFLQDTTNDGEWHFHDMEISQADKYTSRYSWIVTYDMACLYCCIKIHRNIDVLHVLLLC